MMRPILMIMLFVFSSVAFGQLHQHNDEGFIDKVHTALLPEPTIQATLLQSETWQDFKNRHGAWYAEFDEITGLPYRAFGPSIQLPSDMQNTPETMLRFLLEGPLADFDIPVRDLRLSHNTSNDKYTYLTLEQQYMNYPVRYSNVTLRVTPDGRIPMFGLVYHPEINLEIMPEVGTDVLESNAVKGLPGTISMVDPGDYFVLPVRVDQKYNYHLVREIMVHGYNPALGMPFVYKCWIDVHTGEVLFRHNEVCSVHSNHSFSSDSVDILFEAPVIYNPNQQAELKSFPEMRIVLPGNSVMFTDNNGFLELEESLLPLNGTVNLSGKRAAVYQGNGNTQPQATIPINATSPVIDMSNFFTPQQIAGYVHTNIIFNHYLEYTNGGNTYLNANTPALTVNVELTTGGCNAFYNGNSINFYADNGDCPSTVFFSDVVYHEYGHHINNNYINMNNGAVNEGYADVWSLSISKNPILAQGFSGGNSYIRRYDINPKVYPQNVVNQVHADGEIIAGAWWDTYLGLDENLEAFMELFVGSQAGYAEFGDLGHIYRGILIEALLADDDDGDLSNGTPNDLVIVENFALHGITLLTGSIIEHISEPFISGNNSEFKVEAVLALYNEFMLSFLGDVEIHYNVNGSSWQSGIMSVENQDGLPFIFDCTYNIDLPAGEGHIIQYFIASKDAFGLNAVNLPAGVDPASPETSNIPFVTLSGFNVVSFEDFDETMMNGWEVNVAGTDDAETGIWELGKPNGTMAQPSTAHTPGSFLHICWYTGNGFNPDNAGENDVDMGETSLYSAIYDMSSFENPAIGYYRWYSNEMGANPRFDTWEVYITNNLTDWTLIDYTNHPDRSWRFWAIRVADYVEPTSTVRVKFVASDRVVAGHPNLGQSLVEALIDDFYTYDLSSVVATKNMLSKKRIRIFPNPAQNYITVQMDGSDGFKQSDIRIFDMQGKEVFQYNENDLSTAQMLDISHLPAGVYTLKINRGNESESSNFVIQ